MEAKKVKFSWVPVLVFGMLAWLIMAPLVRRGFAFALDMVPTPVWRLPAHVTSSWLFYAVMHWLNFVVPGDVLQKVLLFSVFVVMGLGAQRLALLVLKSEKGTVKGEKEKKSEIGNVKSDEGAGKNKALTFQISHFRFPSLLAGTLYIFNPYVYSRFLAGQFAVLMGYALLPWFVASLLCLLQKPGWRQGVRVGLWLTVVGVVSIHTLGLCGVLLVVGLSASIKYGRQGMDSRLRWNDKKGSLVQVRHSERSEESVLKGNKTDPSASLRMTGASARDDGNRKVKPVETRGSRLEARIKPLLTASGIVVATFILTSSYWLVPALLGKGATAELVAGFGAGDQAAFATVGGSTVSRVVHVLGLQGFWVERTGLYRLPPSIGLVWWLAMGIVAGLVVAGIARFWRQGKSEKGNAKSEDGAREAKLKPHHISHFTFHISPLRSVSVARSRDVVLWLGGSASIATILAAGIGTGWLSSHIPFFSGYREPHKFAGLLALAYAILAASGAAAVWEKLSTKNGLQNPFSLFTFHISLRSKKWLKTLGIGLIIATPFLWSPFMLFGGAHQLHTSQYPAGWYSVNKTFQYDTGDYRVLFLPWHQYMHFGFSQTIMANPASKFFDKPVLVSNNPEFGGATSGVHDPERDKLTRLLAVAPKGQNLGANLAPYNVKYVIVANESDYEKYRYVGQQSDMKLVYKDETIALYRNTAWKENR